MNKVNLKHYNNDWYNPGTLIKRVCWYVVNILLFKTGMPWPYSIKCIVLRYFGAKVGNNVVIKPYVNIKYPWFLEIGNYVWIGEGCWIDSLCKITIGSNVVISQGAYLLTGNHDYKSESFDLILKEIILEDGVWIGAKSIVCPGVTCKKNSVLAAGSVATHDLQTNYIYQGNPAKLKRERFPN